MTDEDLDNLLALAQRIEAGGPINVMPRAAELLRELVAYERARRAQEKKQ